MTYIRASRIVECSAYEIYRYSTGHHETFTDVCGFSQFNFTREKLSVSQVLGWNSARMFYGMGYTIIEDEKSYVRNTSSQMNLNYNQNVSKESYCSK
jgi:hypothetical protein